MELIWQINQLKSFDYWFPLLQFVIIFSKKVDVNDWICDSFEETIKNVMDYKTVSLMHFLFPHNNLTLAINASTWTKVHLHSGDGTS